ncbi:hypothetical protein ABH930_001786 [Kitasatospora sp. GAS204A]|nr:hypothetical protein [Kitasatospora sp. GAS204B]
MHSRSGIPWSITLDFTQDAARALAVRDALGFADPVDPT